MIREFFFNRYKELGEVPKLITIPKTLRVNTLKTKSDILLKRLKALGMYLEKIPFLNHGYVIKDSKFSPGASLEYLLGYYYLQEAAAQIPIQILLSPNETDETGTVLDACAGPGGKTTQLAELTTSPIIALEPNTRRLQALNNNIERLGCPNIATFKLDAADIAQLNIKFKKIIVDAPCSGNFITDNTWFKKRKVGDFKAKSLIQKYLLEKALEVLESKGTLVYSTCSLEPEENEMVIDYILKTHDNIKLEPIKTIGDPGLTNPFEKELDPSIKHTKRFWPWKTNTQGFFEIICFSCFFSIFC